MKIIIDDKELEVLETNSILKSATLNNIAIPAICSYDDCFTTNRCGLCSVLDVEKNELISACSTMPYEGMKIITINEEITKKRQDNMQEIMDNHSLSCKTCNKFKKCELLTTAAKLKVRKNFKAEQFKKEIIVEQTLELMDIDYDKCILCGRCAMACEKEAGTDAVVMFKTDNKPFVGLKYDESKCIYCGQCVKQCPVDAIKEISQIDLIKEALEDETKHCVVAMAPATRVSIGDEFGFAYGENVEAKAYKAFRELGFDRVFDLNYAADVTIMEEGTEIIERYNAKGPFPIYTSCCPGWTEYAKKHYNDVVDSLSSTKSPQQIYGALAKTYYAEKENIKQEDIFVVSVVPCTAKKNEALNSLSDISNTNDIDAILTTRDLAKLIKDKKINFKELEDGKVDSIMGDFSGAGAIFGASGGVLTAALRYATKVVNNNDKDIKLEYKEVKGLKGIKEATIQLEGQDYKVGVINGGSNISEFLKEYIAKENFLLVEVMACNGGCIAGGGQPFLTSHTSHLNQEIKEKRMKGLFDQDKVMDIRVSSETSVIKELYDNYLEKPGSHKAHTLLHTKHRK